MLNFVIGLFFIIINYKVNLPFVPGTLEILPTFIGYAFVLNGVIRYHKEEENFDDIKALILVMFFYSLGIFIMDLIALDYNAVHPILKYTNSILFQKFIPLFIMYKVVWGIIESFKNTGQKIDEDRIKMMFLYSAIVSTMTFFVNDSIFLMVIKLATNGLHLILLAYLTKPCRSFKSAS